MSSLTQTRISHDPHFVGLDVHKNSITIAMGCLDRQPAQVVTQIPHDIPRLIKRLDQLVRARHDLQVCYEAGPTGYGLVRALEKAGIPCIVVAPSLIPKKSGDRIKTDRRDACKLADLHRSGSLTAIRVPDEQEEAIRDLFRTRLQAVEDQRDCRHQLDKFLLRHQRIYHKTTKWTLEHLDWIRTQKFEHEAQNRALRESLIAVEEVSDRIKRLTNDLAEMVQGWRLEPLVQAFQALKGIKLVTAAGLAAEIGDFDRFPSPRKLMSYLGLVPSEFSTGGTINRGRITKTGNTHVRSLLVEAAWSYRNSPKKSPWIRKRWKDLPPAVVATAWKAQDRLHKVYLRLQHKTKPRQKVVTAVARQLVGFIWAIAKHAQNQPK